jgi:hypothetical protein
MPANVQSPARDERSLRTATIADGHHIFLPFRRDFFILLTLDPAMNGWAIVIPDDVAPTELCPFVDGDATNMSALTDLEKSVFHPCSIRG